MLIGFDPAKDAENVRRRGFSFELVPTLAWETAITKEDRRRDYGEQRMQVFVYGAGKPYVVVYTMRGPVRWIISFRKANRREVRAYARAFGR